MRGYTVLTRRTVVIGGGALLPIARAAAQVTTPSKAKIAFDVFRNGEMIGFHTVEFEGDDADLKVKSSAEFLVKLGPIPVFRYKFQSHETWRNGKFSALESQSQTNGTREQLHAESNASAVVVRTNRGENHTFPADALPLSHWNQHALRNPLFNPQTGVLLKERVAHRETEPLRLADGRSIQAAKFVLTGDSEITDWYDESGSWVALRGRLKDGSVLDYRLKA